MSHDTAGGQQNWSSDDGGYLHPHWQKYMSAIESTPDAVFYGFGIFITAVCVVGITGNATAIFIFARYVTRICSCNLALGIHSCDV